jgi:hypothetical protein
MIAPSLNHVLAYKLDRRDASGGYVGFPDNGGPLRSTFRESRISLGMAFTQGLSWNCVMTSQERLPIRVGLFPMGDYAPK